MAFSLDHVVADIRKQSAEGEFNALATQLQNYANELAQTDCAVLDTMIECLDFKAHSLGVMTLLSGKLSRSEMSVEWTTVLQQMNTFSSNFSPEQVGHSPLAFCNLFHRFTELLCLRRKTLEGISVLKCAVDRYRPNPRCLTALHADLIQLCLMAKCLKPALPYLEQEYTELLTEHFFLYQSLRRVAAGLKGGQLDVKYVLLFFYYGGMVHTCLHDYLKSLLCFTVCLTTPTVAISAIMVAAYKKFILISLLKFGKVITLPRYSSHIIERVMKPLCGAYSELARAYTAGKASAIQPVIAKYSEAFTTDGNAGLIQRLVACVHRHSVQKLTHTFMTLGLSDVSSRVGLSGAHEAEKYIRDMVEDGEVHASLDQLGSRVSFTESPENYDNLHMVANMDKQLSVCVALEQKLSSFEKEMAADPRYIHRALGTGIDEDPLFQDEAVM